MKTLLLIASSLAIGSVYAVSNDENAMGSTHITIDKVSAVDIQGTLRLVLDGTVKEAHGKSDLVVNNDQSFDIVSDNLIDVPIAPTAMPSSYEKTQQPITVTTEGILFHVSIGGPLSIRTIRVKDITKDKFDISVTLRSRNGDHWRELSNTVKLILEKIDNSNYKVTVQYLSDR